MNGIVPSISPAERVLHPPTIIPQMEPWLGDEERDAVTAYMAGGGWITEFRKTAEFEEVVARFCGVRHGIAVPNGTVSLTLAALALGIGPGDEVLVPNFTMIATANAVRMAGAKPVLVDVEPDTLCMDLERAAAALTPATKAVFFVNINGRQPRAGIEPLVRFCSERGLALVEDAAQALGSYFDDGSHMGSKGRIASISFSSQKIVTTGQGGMLLTDHDDLAEKLRRLKDFGRSGGGADIHDTLGYNFKFTDLQACIGLAQMAKLPDRIVRKRRLWKSYRERLQDIPQVRLFERGHGGSTPWFIDIRAERRDELRTHLAAAGIGTRLMYPPIHAQRAYRLEGEFPVSTAIGAEGLWLPSATQLEDWQIDRVCDAIRAFYASDSRSGGQRALSSAVPVH